MLQCSIDDCESTWESTAFYSFRNEIVSCSAVPIERWKNLVHTSQRARLTHFIGPVQLAVSTVNLRTIVVEAFAPRVSTESPLNSHLILIAAISAVTVSSIIFIWNT